MGCWQTNGGLLKHKNRPLGCEGQLIIYYGVGGGKEKGGFKC